jgi:uridine kinase
MSIPNTVVKFVDREGEIVEFDQSRIADSIADAIRDVEDDSRFSLPDRRAQLYTEKIVDRVYREYYDLDWLSSEFVIQYISYDEGERHHRMDDAFVTERLTFVLLETFKDRISSRDPADEAEELEAFIQEEIENADVDPKYTHSLFPDLSEDEMNDIVNYLHERVLKMSDRDLPADVLCPTREYIQDTIEKELKRMGEIELAEGYMIYREGRKKVNSGDISELQFTNNGIHKDVVRRTIEWNIDHRCDSVFELNKWMKREDGRDPSELIEAAESRFRDDLSRTADKILDRKDDIEVVIIAGPSCSNKTTATVMIGDELEKEGLKFKELNVDDYFYDLKDQPKDKFGDYDFEMPEAIDMNLLNQHLETLLNGEPIDKPRYNFEKGCRDGTERFERDEDEIILIDCLHGLYRRLTSSVPQTKKFRIYIESMNVLRNINGHATRWADVRMLKRMLRDSKHRGYSMERTLSHWPYVRKGELKHIIPYIFSTEAVINSGLPYELPVLKQVIGDEFPDDDYIDGLKSDQRLDAYVRGKRTKALLDTIEPIPDLDLVPGTSPIREFIGGSEYEISHND